MAERKQFEGRDLADAVRAASEGLGLPESRLRYELAEPPRRGVFGLGAKVRIWAEPEPDRESAPVTALERSFDRAETAAKDAEWLRTTLAHVVGLMRFDLQVSAAPEGGGVRAELAGPDRERLLEADGELLDALQFLLNRIVALHRPELGRVRLECDGFRQDRDQDLIDLARDTAQRVALSGKARWLPPLNPYERRLVHITVQEMSGVSTSSSG